MTEELEREVDRMCNLSQGVYDRAVDKITVEHIKSMMNNKGWDIEECMDILDISEDKREYYRDEVLGLVTS